MGGINPPSFYRPPSTRIDNSFCELIKAEIEKMNSSSSSSGTTDPISFSGSSSSRGNVGDEIRIKAKNISADDVQKQLKTREFRPTYNLARGELNQLTRKCQNLRSELSKVKNQLTTEEQKEKMDSAKITELTDKETKLEEQIEILEKAIKGYKTLTEQGINGITGENADELMEKNQEAFDAIQGLKDPSIADTALNTGNLEQVAKKALEYKQQKIAELSEKYDDEVSQKHSERAAAVVGSAATTATKGTTQRIETAQRQLTRAEKAGNVDGQIKAQERIVAALEQQIKDSNEQIKNERSVINDKINILRCITHPEIIVMNKPNENQISKDDMIKLLNKYPNGFELKSVDGKQTIKVTKEQIAEALKVVNERRDENDLKHSSLAKIANCGYNPDGEDKKVVGETSEYDRTMYNRLKAMSDDEFLVLLRYGNENSENRSHNIKDGYGHSNQTLVQSLFDCYDKDVSMMYIVGRLASIAVKKGVPKDQLNSIAQEALYFYGDGKNVDTQGLKNIQDRLSKETYRTWDSDDKEWETATFGEQNSLQALLYGCYLDKGTFNDTTECTEAGDGVRQNGLVAQALTGKQTADTGKIDDKNIKYNTSKMPKIELPSDFQWTVKYYDETFRKHVNQPNAELAEKLDAAKAKLAELQEKKNAPVVEQPVKEAVVTTLNQADITKKANDIISTINQEIPGWKEAAKATVMQMPYSDETKDAICKIIDDVKDSNTTITLPVTVGTSTNGFYLTTSTFNPTNSAPSMQSQYVEDVVRNFSTTNGFGTATSPLQSKNSNQSGYSEMLNHALIRLERYARGKKTGSMSESELRRMERTLDSMILSPKEQEIFEAKRKALLGE